MTKSLLHELPSIVEQVIARESEAFASHLERVGQYVANDFNQRGMLRSGAYLKTLSEAFSDAARQHTKQLLAEVFNVAQEADGSVDEAALDWIRGRLTSHLKALAGSIETRLKGEFDKIGGPPRGVMSTGIGRLDLQRDLTIGLARVRAGGPARANPTGDSDMDDLVPIRSRRAFDPNLRDELERAKSSNRPLALVRFDIDGFKAVNDQHGGHETGDQALFEVARLTDECVSGKGAAYRVGGDEFAIILPNHDEQEALAIAERLRRTVENSEITTRLLRITLSLGVATFPAHAVDLEGLSKAADEACYEAKSLGKNLVRIHGEKPAAEEATQVERRLPSPSGLTADQRERIRNEYFRVGVARCPKDDAILDVLDATPFGARRKTISVQCPQCGMAEKLD